MPIKSSCNGETYAVLPRQSLDGRAEFFFFFFSSLFSFDEMTGRQLAANFPGRHLGPTVTVFFVLTTIRPPLDSHQARAASCHFGNFGVMGELEMTQDSFS